MKDVELDVKKLRKARKLDVEYVKDRKVYKYAKHAEAIWLRHKIIGVE